jgi:hypothetical protein
MHPALALLVARFPRGMATLWTACALGLVHLLRPAFDLGRGLLFERRISARGLVVYGASAAAVGAGLWVMIVGIPIDDETGRPPDWWYLGLGCFAVAGFGLRAHLASGMTALFP